MKTIRILAALAAVLAASLSCAESLKIKGMNGRFATVDVLSVEKAGMTVVTVANGPQVFVPWASVDLEYLAANHPQLDQRRRSAIEGRQAEANTIFTQATDAVTISSIKERLMQRLSLWDGGALAVVRAVGSRNDANHKFWVSQMTSPQSSEVIDQRLLPALREAYADSDKLPAGGAKASFRDGLIGPALRAAEDMRRGSKVTKHEWIEAFSRLSAALGS